MPLIRATPTGLEPFGRLEAESDTRGCTGADHVAGLQRDDAREVRDEFRYPEDQFFVFEF